MAEGRSCDSDLICVISATSMACYAGATWDWTHTHLDQAAAQAAGFERPIVDGQMLGALLALHALRNGAPGMRIERMRFRHADAVLCEDRIRISGEVHDDDGRVRTLWQHVDVIDTDGGIVRRAIVDAETRLEFDA